MSRPVRAAAWCASVAVVLSLSTVTPSHAATVSSSGGVITYQASPGEANGASVDRSLSGSDFVVRDGKVALQAGSGCAVASSYTPNDISCPASSVTRIRFLLGDGDDDILVYSGVGVAVTTEIDAGPGAGGLQSIRSESPGRTLITGGPGTDAITGGDGDDVIHGGAGDDTITSGPGHDEIHGDGGIDEVRAGPGADDVNGGDGDDLLYGDPGMDTVRGDAGNDRLYGEQDADVLEGGDGDDWLHDDGSFEQGFASGDVLRGGAGRDLADYGSRGGTLPVTITLDEQANDGSAQERDNVGPEGDIEIVEGSGNDDVLVGSDRADELRGGFGDDSLDGRGGDDLLDGFGGNDKLAGGAGNDTLSGSADSDGLLGEDGDDQLLGGTGDDSIGGGAGADLLDGGLGSDTLLARDGVVDQIRCSLGSDAAEVDAADIFLDRPQCETVSGGASAGGTPAGGATTPGVTFTLLSVTSVRIGALIRTGLPVRLRLARPARVRAELLLRRAVASRVGRGAAARPVVIGRVSTGLRRAGTVAIRVKPSRSGARRLRRVRRTVTLTLRVVVTAPAGKQTTTTRKLTLRR